MSQQINRFLCRFTHKFGSFIILNWFLIEKNFNFGFFLLSLYIWCMCFFFKRTNNNKWKETKIKGSKRLYQVNEVPVSFPDRYVCVCVKPLLIRNISMISTTLLKMCIACSMLNHFSMYIVHATYLSIFSFGLAIDIHWTEFSFRLFFSGTLRSKVRLYGKCVEKSAQTHLLTHFQKNKWKECVFFSSFSNTSFFNQICSVTGIWLKIVVREQKHYSTVWR